MVDKGKQMHQFNPRRYLCKADAKETTEQPADFDDLLESLGAVHVQACEHSAQGAHANHQGPTHARKCLQRHKQQLAT